MIEKASFVHCRGSAFYSGAIRAVTGGKYNHSLMKFYHHDGRAEYIESYWHVDPETGKTGVHGPVPWSKFEEWMREDPSHAYINQMLPYSPEQCQAAYDFLCDAVPVVEYPVGQLYFNLKTCLLGCGMRSGYVTRLKWTCSETCARAWAVMDPEAAMKYLGIGEVLWDMIVPSNAKYGLYEATERFLRDRAQTQ